MPSLDLGQVVGATPQITAGATVDGNTGTPAVNVVQTGTVEQPTLTFNFSNLKGAKGDDGAAGTTPTVSASASVNSSTGTPAVTVSNTGTATAANFNFEFSNLKGADGAAGQGVPYGGTTGQALVKNSNTAYDTKWSSKVDAAASADTAGSVGYSLYMGAVDNSGVKSAVAFDGSATKRLYNCRFIHTLTTSGWSASANANGYYTQTKNFVISSGGATSTTSINTYYPVSYRLIGTDINTLPTSAQKTAFDLINYAWADDGANVFNVTYYAKTKPTTEINVCVEAYSNSSI